LARSNDCAAALEFALVPPPLYLILGGAMVPNNLDNRARQLSENIKNGGIKLYVIDFDLAGNTHALKFVKSMASPTDQNGVCFFDAPRASDLDAVFKQIAASFSNLRVSM